MVFSGYISGSASIYNNDGPGKTLTWHVTDPIMLNGSPVYNFTSSTWNDSFSSKSNGPTHTFSQQTWPLNISYTLPAVIANFVGTGEFQLPVAATAFALSQTDYDLALINANGTANVTLASVAYN